jgi:hypothetical protein
MEQEESEEEAWGDVTEQDGNYQETVMPYNTASYFSETGIWNTVLDTDQSLISFARNDTTGLYTRLSWTQKKQKEATVSSAKNKVAKRLAKGNPKFVPYQTGKTTGYWMYGKKAKKSYCYLLDQKGNLLKEISLQAFLEEQGIGQNSDAYGIKNLIPLENNRIAVVIPSGGEHGGWYSFYINVNKNKLVSVEKSDDYVIGVDSKYCYKIQTAGEILEGHGDSFKKGTFVIENRKTGEQAAVAKIPNDIISKSNDSISQCFDIKNGTVWFANRTGIYCLTAGDSQWTRIMNSEQSSYLNQKYTLTDITAVDGNTFYLLFMEGDDDESASVLVKYTKK